jgi:hypothetical protein
MTALADPPVVATGAPARPETTPTIETAPTDDVQERTMMWQWMMKHVKGEGGNTVSCVCGKSGLIRAGVLHNHVRRCEQVHNTLMRRYVQHGMMALSLEKNRQIPEFKTAYNKFVKNGCVRGDKGVVLSVHPDDPVGAGLFSDSHRFPGNAGDWQNGLSLYRPSDDDVERSKQIAKSIDQGRKKSCRRVNRLDDDDEEGGAGGDEDVPQPKKRRVKSHRVAGDQQLAVEALAVTPPLSENVSSDAVGVLALSAIHDGDVTATVLSKLNEMAAHYKETNKIRQEAARGRILDAEQKVKEAEQKAKAARAHLDKLKRDIAADDMTAGVQFNNQYVTALRKIDAAKVPVV